MPERRKTVVDPPCCDQERGVRAPSLPQRAAAAPDCKITVGWYGSAARRARRVSTASLGRCAARALLVVGWRAWCPTRKLSRRGLQCPPSTSVAACSSKRGTSCHRCACHVLPLLLRTGTGGSRLVIDCAEDPESYLPLRVLLLRVALKTSCGLLLNAQPADNPQHVGRLREMEVVEAGSVRAPRRRRGLAGRHRQAQDQKHERGGNVPPGGAWGR
jgi:hypothetical protein